MVYSSQKRYNESLNSWLAWGKMNLSQSLRFIPILEVGAFLYSGGLQVRGIKSNHLQLSLNRYWYGDLALFKMYPKLNSMDIPFAQDCFGDQFFERKGVVFQLFAETGEIESIDKSPEEFLAWSSIDPIERLNLPSDLNLSDGKLLLAYPPFCTAEGNKSSIKEIDNDEVINFHADFSKQISLNNIGDKIKPLTKD